MLYKKFFVDATPDVVDRDEVILSLNYYFNKLKANEIQLHIIFGTRVTQIIEEWAMKLNISYELYSVADEDPATLWEKRIEILQKVDNVIIFKGNQDTDIMDLEYMSKTLHKGFRHKLVLPKEPATDYKPIEKEPIPLSKSDAIMNISNRVDKQEIIDTIGKFKYRLYVSGDLDFQDQEIMKAKISFYISKLPANEVLFLIGDSASPELYSGVYAREHGYEVMNINSTDIAKIVNLANLSIIFTSEDYEETNELVRILRKYQNINLGIVKVQSFLSVK